MTIFSNTLTQTTDDYSEFSELWSVIEQVLHQEIKGKPDADLLPTVPENKSRNIKKVFLERRVDTVIYSDCDTKEFYHNKEITNLVVTDENSLEHTNSDLEKSDSCDLDCYLQHEITKLHEDQNKCQTPNQDNTKLKSDFSEQNTVLVNDLISNILREDNQKSRAKPYTRKILPKTDNKIKSTIPNSDSHLLRHLSSEKCLTQETKPVFPMIKSQEKKKIFTCTYVDCLKTYVKSSHLKVCYQLYTKTCFFLFIYQID